MDMVEGMIANAEEPAWLEKPIIGAVRAWQVIFLCFAGMTTIVISLCCCIRFRVPRTKQQIEADYQRKKLTKKFYQQLEKIQDSKMDSISLKDALDIMRTSSNLDTDSEHQTTSQVSSIVSPINHGSNDNSNPSSTNNQEPQMNRVDFMRLATRVNQISKIARQSQGAKSPAPSNTHIDF